MRTTWLCWLGFSLALVSCKGGGGDDNGDADHPSSTKPGASSAKAACDAVEACEGASGRASCEQLFDLIAPTRACTSAIEAASCEDHARDVPSYMDVCLPPCDGSKPRCNDDETITRCVDSDGESRLATIRCEAACMTEGAAYVGVCGRAYGGMTSDEDKCWCDTKGNPPDGEPMTDVAVAAADAVDASKACAPIFECGEACSYESDYVLITQECLDAIEAASCEEHGLEARPYYDTCFPRCTAPTAFCNDDGTVTVCASEADAVPRWRTYSCERICEEERGEAFSGVCVSEFSSSSDAWPDCGCEG
jgi:hypothetical protein